MAIKHIVYLMLENRSFDNVLGWLYDDQNNKPAHTIDPDPNPPLYQGLKENTYYNLDIANNKHWVTKGTDSGGHSIGPLYVPEEDPNEDYLAVNNQLFMNQDNPSFGTPPNMGGFYQDFNNHKEEFHPIPPAWPEQIMQTYTQDADSLPVLNGAAKNWAVSDAYFSAIPTQTNCNRAFAATGNSIAPDGNNNNVLTAFVNNNMGDLGEVEIVFNQKTMFEALQAANIDWKIFASQGWSILDGYCFTRDILGNLKNRQYDNNFSTMEEFNTILEGTSGILPAFSFLEPEWGYGPTDENWWPKFKQGDDYHPPTNVAPGEASLANLLNKIQQSKYWNETLLIINFDEHGGTYDHIPPPWSASPPWQNKNDGTPTPETTEHGFGFDRFGVRVPLILVSPYIEQSTVIRAGGTIPFDHASVIATVLTMFGVPKSDWQLGTRVAQAPTFENVLTRATPRTDIKKFEISQATQDAITAGAELDLPPNELQKSIAIRALKHSLRKNKANGNDIAIVQTDMDKITQATTKTEYMAAIKPVMEKLKMK